MRQGNCSYEGRFGRQERGRGGGRPFQRPGDAFQGISQLLQSPGNAGQESTVEVDHAEKLLELLDVTWLRKLFDGRDVALQRSNSVFIDPVT